jgi:hypothetical protein
MLERRENRRRQLLAERQAAYAALRRPPRARSPQPHGALSSQQGRLPAAPAAAARSPGGVFKV